MSAILAVICGLLIIGADQLTKYLVITNMAENQIIQNVIPGILNFNRIPPNTGAAFGIFQGQFLILHKLLKLHRNLLKIHAGSHGKLKRLNLARMYLIRASSCPLML